MREQRPSAKGAAQSRVERHCNTKGRCCRVQGPAFRWARRPLPARPSPVRQEALTASARVLRRPGPRPQVGPVAAAGRGGPAPGGARRARRPGRADGRGGLALLRLLCLRRLLLIRRRCPRRRRLAACLNHDLQRGAVLWAGGPRLLGGSSGSSPGGARAGGPGRAGGAARRPPLLRLLRLLPLRRPPFLHQLLERAAIAQVLEQVAQVLHSAAQHT